MICLFSDIFSLYLLWFILPVPVVLFKNYNFANDCNSVLHLGELDAGTIEATNTTSYYGGRTCFLYLIPPYNTSGLILNVEYVNLRDCDDTLTIANETDLEHPSFGPECSLRHHAMFKGEVPWKIIFTTSGKYMSDVEGHNFKIVYNTYNKRSCNFGEFRCLNGLCINTSLQCDGINNCADVSDECQWCSSGANCKMELFITAIVGGVVGLWVFIVFVLLIWRMGSAKKDPIPTDVMPFTDVDSELERLQNNVDTVGRRPTTN